MNDAPPDAESQTAPLRRLERAREWGFLALLAAVLVAAIWVCNLYPLDFDWTWRQRGSLTEASIQVLDTLEGQVRVTAFARGRDVVRARVSRLIDRYRRYKADLSLEFVNPDLRPDLARRLGVRIDGELIVAYGEREERLRELSERSFTAALHRLAHSRTRGLRFLTGHGERSPEGRANFDLGDFVAAVREQGLVVESTDADRGANPPAEEAVVVLAGPKTRLLEQELILLAEHLSNGGNLLVLLDPDTPGPLQPLLGQLGVSILPGVIVDATTRSFGIDDPAFALVTRYPAHSITEGLDSVTLFPRAAGLEAIDNTGWTITPLLSTLERSWTETGAIDGRISFDEDGVERAGPITLGIALTRQHPDREAQQRVLVIGDGDFLANSHLGNGANLALGLNMVGWLAAGESASPMVALQSAPDLRLELSDSTLATLAILMLVIAPGGLALCGFVVLRRRRRHAAR